MNMLFVCSKNQWRASTVKVIYLCDERMSVPAARRGIEFAGLELVNAAFCSAGERMISRGGRDG
ncbi:hypothetical protein LF1_09110 [Rubripirellula obstinata]|uniref:Uncharacterized protein n=1 Tax=Rubripirellula obstinata TaxID=406547 RepID=A0A5B1CDW4_9BACT|nr:hypothetical protein LF1_09110 [Rubripirellula obstinata]